MCSQLDAFEKAFVRQADLIFQDDFGVDSRSGALAWGWVLAAHA